MTTSDALQQLHGQYQARLEQAAAAGDHDLAELFEARRERVSALLSDRHAREERRRQQAWRDSRPWQPPRRRGEA